MQLIYCTFSVFRLMLEAGGEWREGNGGGRGESFLCFSQSTKRLDPALMSPLIPLKLNFNGLLLATVQPCVSVCVWKICLCAHIMLHSQFSLQVQRFLHIVLATAQVDEDGVAAGCHLLFVLLLQLEGTLQVLIRQQRSQEKNNPKQNTKTKQLTSKKKTKEKEPYETKRNFTSSALRAWMACLRTSPNGLFSAFSSANLFSSANTLPSIP